MLVHTPISMLQAWSTFLVIDSAFAAFGERTGFEPHAWTKAYVIIALLALEVASAVYAFASLEGDLAANITITWVLYGIARSKCQLCELKNAERCLIPFSHVQGARTSQTPPYGGLRYYRLSSSSSQHTASISTSILPISDSSLVGRLSLDLLKIERRNTCYPSSY